MSNLPLTGIRVADFTQALSGPYCTLLLADMGADVVKVERPHGGDDSRHWGPPFVDDTASYFLSINRNKRSIALDLKDTADSATARALADSSDVVIENWRPGTAARLGLGHEELRRDRPQLVYCSISGFGADVPVAGYDQVIQGTSGWMSLTGSATGGPFKTGVPIADIASGMFAAQSILGALLRRERTGSGGFVDISMQDCLVSMLAYHAGSYFATEHAPRRNGNHHGTVAPYGTFPTKDGQVNISVGNDRQWERLCAAWARPDLATDLRFADNRARLEHRADLHEAIEAILATQSTENALQAAAVAGVPAGPIRDLAEVFTDPATSARGMILEAEHPRLGTVRSPGAAWRIDDVTAAARLAPPDLGQHSDEIRSELGRRHVGAGTDA